MTGLVFYFSPMWNEVGHNVTFLWCNVSPFDQGLSPLKGRANFQRTSTIETNPLRCGLILTFAF
jgi:hypothetical protein